MNPRLISTSPLLFIRFWQQLFGVQLFSHLHSMPALALGSVYRIERKRNETNRNDNIFLGKNERVDFGSIYRISYLEFLLKYDVISYY